VAGASVLNASEKVEDRGEIASRMERRQVLPAENRSGPLRVPSRSSPAPSPRLDEREVALRAQDDVVPGDDPDEVARGA